MAVRVNPQTGQLEDDTLSPVQEALAGVGTLNQFISDVLPGPLSLPFRAIQPGIDYLGGQEAAKDFQGISPSGKVSQLARLAGLGATLSGLPGGGIVGKKLNEYAGTLPQPAPFGQAPNQAPSFGRPQESPIPQEPQRARAPGESVFNAPVGDYDVEAESQVPGGLDITHTQYRTPPTPFTLQEQPAYSQVMRNGRPTYTNVPGQDQVLGTDNATPPAMSASAFGQEYKPVGPGNYSQMNDNRVAMMNPLERAQYQAELAKAKSQEKLYGLSPKEQATLGQRPDVGQSLVALGLQLVQRQQQELAMNLQDLEQRRKRLSPEQYEMEKRDIVEENRRTFEMYRDMLGLARGVRPIESFLPTG